MTRSTETEDEGFLGRWARRKEESRRGERPEAEEDASLPAAPQDEAADPEPQVEQRVLTDADMPDVESLGPKSDVSAFFSPGVSQALRRKALRRLFHTPRFNVKDGLDDYDEDYTVYQPLGDTITSELRRLQARREVRRREREEEAAAPADAEQQATGGADDAAPGAEATNRETQVDAEQPTRRPASDDQDTPPA